MTIGNMDMHETSKEHKEKVTVLLIEDDQFLREEALAWLHFEGYNAIGAANGIEGVRLAQVHRPDLVVSDIMMPEKDGFAVLTEMRSHPETLLVPFIFLTARAERSDVRHSMQLGADDYITKPFSREELLNAIESRLLRQAAHAEQAKESLDELRRVLNYTLPHEMRTPLNAILGFAELLSLDAGTLSNKVVAEIAGHILHSGRRLHHLIENYLVYAQIEFLRNDSEQTAVLRHTHAIGVGAAVRRTAATLAGDYARTSDLQLAVDESEPFVTVGNQDWEKIIFELIDNAFKFSAQGTPVTITATSGAHQYVLVIQDHGRGMTADQIHQIAAYAQFNRRIYEQKGTGLGLAIAKGLVDLYGGTFELQSEPAQGVRVSVALQCQAAGPSSE
jgi:two-component system, sensor histidine kinase and response regulator